MRRSLAVGLAFLLTLLTTLAPVSVQAESDIQIVFDGEPVVFEVPPVIRSDRTFVPVRFVLERIQAEVKWDEVKRQVSVTYGPKTVVLTIDSRRVLVNGKAVEIDVAPFIHMDRTMVPLRFLAETFTFGVTWDEGVRTVLLNSPPPLMAMLDTTPGTAPVVTTPPSTPSTGGGTVTAPPTTPSTGGGTVAAPPPVTGTPTPGTNRIVVLAPASVQSGNTFRVEVELQNAVDVAGIDVALYYDSTLVEPLEEDGFIPGSAITGVTAKQGLDLQNSRAVYASALLQNKTFSATGRVFAVRFRAKASGNAAFTLAPTNPEAEMLRDETTTVIPATTLGASVRIQ